MPISTSSHQNNDDDDISDAVLHGKVPSERLFQPHKPTNRHAASAKQASLRYLRLTDEFRGGSRDGLRGKHGVHKARPDSWPSKELPSSCRVLDGVTPRTARAPSAPSRPLAPGRRGGRGAGPSLRACRGDCCCKLFTSRSCRDEVCHMASPKQPLSPTPYEDCRRCTNVTFYRQSVS